MLKALSTAWDRPFEFAFNSRGHSAAGLIYQRLREPGNTILINVDAPWEKRTAGSFSRPFAGKKERLFSTGVAQLADLTNCPIICCSYWEEPDRTIVLDWGTPIRKVEGQIETMNRLLDQLEVAVGERPTQYVLTIGGDRQWNATQKRWEN
jgi:lauroyl/myristoyl acyltransferase